MTFRDYESPLDIPAELRETLYGHEILRIAGISADDIFVSLQDSDIVIIVKAQGAQYAFSVAETALTAETLPEMWSSAVRLWNATCNSDPRWDFQGSNIRQNAVRILVGLEMAGIRLDSKEWN